MPLELDFDNLESASNYMHTYALSQGFDIRIQWSANNQTRICWSCYRGGFPETLNPDGTPNTKKRQIPKEKERRKRGSLKIGCPFRVQCTKNWKTGKMELRILEGRHKHQMETDRENLPSQVRRIKNQRKAHESPGTPQGGNAAANAVAQAANLTVTPTPAPAATGSGSQAAKGRQSGAANGGGGGTNRNGAAGQQRGGRAQQQPAQAQQQQTMTPANNNINNNHNNTNLLVNAAGPSAHQHLSLLGTPTPAMGTPTPSNGATPLDLDSDLVLPPSTSTGAVSSSPGPKPSFERQMLNLLGVYDKSDGSSRAIMDKELETMLARAESRLDRNARKKRKIGPNGMPVDAMSPMLAATPAGTSLLS
ncbi:hypothetical protein NDA16_000025 [Ustilago loliicola]|nr:hypothetical protein NDA16_000025 [Ustilago loliicola]